MKERMPSANDTRMIPDHGEDKAEEEGNAPWRLICGGIHESEGRRRSRGEAIAI
jgi:hypothetical protein